MARASCPRHCRATPALCSLVLVKTSTFLYANYEQTAKLKYELALHSKLQAAIDRAKQQQGNTKGKPDETVLQANDSSASASEHALLAATLPQVVDRPQLQVCHANGIRPHLRALADSRLALILPDLGGVLLRTLILEQSAQPSLRPAGGDMTSPTIRPACRRGLRFRQRASHHACTAADAVPGRAAVGATCCGPGAQSLHPGNVTVNVQSGAAQWLDLTAASLLATDRASADYNYHLHPPEVWQVRKGRTHEGRHARGTSQVSMLLTCVCCAVCYVST